MSIRFKLVVSYIAMVIFPIILSTITILFLLYNSISRICHIYNMKLSKNPVKVVRVIENMHTNSFSQISNTIENNPEYFKDLSYLNTIDRNLKNNNSGVIVVMNNSILYTSEIIKKLGINAINIQDDEIRVLGNQWLIKHEDFTFGDDNKGTVYLITDTKPVVNIVESFIISSIISVLIIIILSDGILTYLVSKSILTPINELKKASFRIKEGDLDFNIGIDAKDEIGALCVAFEEMRCKLKESVDIQLQYENNRKELISNISHDLKTPVTAVKGYIEGIMDGVADTPEKMEKYTKTIYAKASAMDKLIDELFLFSKLDLKRLPFNFEKVDIAKYLRDCVEELQFDLEKKKIKLGLNIQTNNSIIVLVDRERLKRVIINLVDNAVKYMDKEQGIIDICLTEEKYNVLLQIKDNGKGISSEALPFIFDRFYRADSSRNTATGGSGLGLAIAKRIIEEHGGIIGAESEKNEGTTIYFTLKKI